MMANDNGTTNFARSALTTSNPSVAPNTEIAGVMMPSPYRNAPPNKPSMISAPRHRSGRSAFRRVSMINASSAYTPPSPRLSARRMKPTYFTATISTNDQTISDNNPKTFADPGFNPYDALKASLIA